MNFEANSIILPHCFREMALELSTAIARSEGITSLHMPFRGSGDPVGESVGANVGYSVGSDGTSVGRKLGMCEGTSLGLTLGAKVGVSVQ
jgi:hypothetical protein